EIMMLHAQRRIAENPADGEAQSARGEKGEREGAAHWRQQRHRVSPDADESALGERYLARIAERQVEAERCNRQHRPHRDQIDAERLEQQRRDQRENCGCCDRARGEPFHIVRSSTRPSRPCGRSRMTAIRMTSGKAPRYWDEM